MTINLTPELECALADAAKRQGTTPELLAIDYLRQRFLDDKQSCEPAGSATSLAEFLKGSIGVLDSSEFIHGGANLSENTGEAFTAIISAKRKQGRL